MLGQLSTGGYEPTGAAAGRGKRLGQRLSMGLHAMDERRHQAVIKELCGWGSGDYGGMRLGQRVVDAGSITGGMREGSSSRKCSGARRYMRVTGRGGCMNE